MERKLVIVGMIFMMLMGLSIPLTGESAEPAAKKYEWKFFIPGTPTVPFSPLNVQMCEKIKERSMGRLEIKYYFYGELPYKNADVLNVVRDRKVELGSCFDGHGEGVQDWYGLI
jgi:TRAP-type C4-dicarboxylate transport system substrate-binding protein